MNTDSNAVFRLALSLTGGVSTGAYQAGVMDFLIEALDAFERAREAHDEQAPPHAVRVEAICGASSGALTAAITGSALRYAFEPAASGAGRARCDANPLFNAWVNMTGAPELLGTADAKWPGLRSLLDCTSLDEVASNTITFGAGHSLVTRGWIADPLQICFSVTNLDGIPFSLSSKAGIVTPTLVTHADVLRFNIRGLGTIRPHTPWPDEADLTFPSLPTAPRPPGWRAFGAGAVASAAFPVVLVARSIDRTLADYGNFQVALPAGKGRPATISTLVPSLKADAEGRIVFRTADGGIVDNSPVDLARAALNQRDVLASNESSGSQASQAVLMIDPMISQPPAAPANSMSRTLLSDIAPLVGALVDQARFRPEEVALAQDPQVFSRFLIAPWRTDPEPRSGGAALAGASCYSFGGYLSPSFREHDFHLGRFNAQAFLADQLTLKPENPLFLAWRNDERFSKWTARYQNKDGELPIIPLIGNLHPRDVPIREPAWPKHAVDTAALGTMIDTRLDFIHDRIVAAWKPGNFWGTLAKWLQNFLWAPVRSFLRGKLVSQVNALLKAHDLA